MGVGFPASINLNEFGSKVWDAFGQIPYHVGSSIDQKIWRDVDVRLILSDEEFHAMGFGVPSHCHRNEKWIAMCMAFSALGKEMTGLPIDFQIQQITDANKNYDKPRSAIGHIPLRYNK